MIARLLIVMIKFYQKAISPLFRSSCRFYPSCSTYWIEAIRTYGACKGLLLGVKRLLKCHPYHPGGVDMVPANSAGTPSREDLS